MPLCKCGCGKTVKKIYAKGHNVKRGIGGLLRDRIMANISIDEKTGCWNWTAGTSGNGYGELRLKNGLSGGQRGTAHRISYSEFVGEIPAGMMVCHKCDNRLCVNPNHLFIGTAQDNLTDMVKKGRSLKGEKNHKSILSDFQVAEIKNSNTPLKIAAEKYGVHFSTISKIRTGKNWGWLSPQ